MSALIAVFTIGLLIGARRRSGRGAVAAAPAAVAPAPPARAARRFRPEPPPMPDGAWTCQIAWRRGPLGARFLALAVGAEDKRVEIARSTKIDWPPFLPPTASDELVTPARALVHALVEAGWQHTGSGEAWYEQRFAWHGAEAPGPLGEIAPSAMVEHG